MKPCSDFFWRSLPLSNQTGSDVFDALFQARLIPSDPLSRTERIATLLESPYPLPPDSLPEQAIAMARYSICAGAPRRADGKLQFWTPAVGKVLPLFRQMEQLSREPASVTTVEGVTVDEDLPFIGGWLGWLGYDFAWEVERLPWLRSDKLPFPVAFWYEPAEFAVLDHFQQRLWLAAETLAGLEEMTEQIAVFDPAALHRQWNTHSLKFETEQAEFEQAVRVAKDHIRAGDVFQVNHSLRFSAQTDAPSWEVYRTLQRINPSPFASYWRSPWGDIVSCSPERLVHLKGNRVQSRPIAGTRPRGATAAADQRIAAELRGDIKERAEHIMLVDLERNDLGRVCQWGSVAVEELMTIERYSHVMHLVSNVTGKLHQSAAALVASMFPGGTITGCPKVRCMEIIEAIEPVRRSLFYGSCGYFDRRGRLDLNILIRTLLLAIETDNASVDEPSSAGESRLVWGQVGAGIVADSQPEKEWIESLQKAKAQLIALGL
ncbi:MAG: anthranilate synthase component I [Leptolyngbya foveolarum]|uniref:Anthranilate synthase component 1 n=1 Tax=Leptolyngbya foveolarum TaxID=47253 RepID=A0A2W4VYE0_9CYAN|nr:MAG: anthranilate synthase component I [Leptolyngbya foveolarum]